jgi:hypothetical protein
MGLLDDAIREHLDLKRKHGVPEEDLQRQEEEALGPVRRDVAPAESDDDGAQPDSAPDAGDEAAADAAAEPPVPFDGASEAPPEPEAAQAEPEAEAEPEPAAPDSSADGEPPEELPVVDQPTAVHEMPFDEAALDEPPPLGEEQRPPEPEPEPQPDEEEPAPHSDTPTQGYEALDDDELLDEEDEPSSEDGDVLEDTPDFLQETPEHDRLWFEQKPPRDFDFD